MLTYKEHTAKEKPSRYTKTKCPVGLVHDTCLRQDTPHHFKVSSLLLYVIPGKSGEIIPCYMDI